MLSLKERLDAVKSNKPEVMYSVAGANFQEWALNRIDARGSIAHKSIGTLVTEINNNQITVAQAEAKFISLLA